MPDVTAVVVVVGVPADFLLARDAVVVDVVIFTAFDL